MLSGKGHVLYMKQISETWGKIEITACIFLMPLYNRTKQKPTEETLENM